MAANEEYSLVFIRMPNELRQLMRILPQCFLRVQEFRGHGITFEGLDGGGVEGGGATVGGGDYDLSVGLEDFVGVGKLGLVVGGRLASVRGSDGIAIGMGTAGGERETNKIPENLKVSE